VADGTVRGEAGRDVIGHRAAKSRGALPRGQMAAVAGRRIQRVVVAHMAGRAGSRRRRNVHSCKRKSSCAVVKRCSGKSHCRVAIGAVGHGK